MDEVPIGEVRRLYGRWRGRGQGEKGFVNLIAKKIATSSFDVAIFWLNSLFSPFTLHDILNLLKYI
jgi:hypothetical protein